MASLWSEDLLGPTDQLIRISDMKLKIVNVPTLHVNFFQRTLTLSYPGGGGKIRPLLFFLLHPKTAQGIKLKRSDFKDTLLRHILQVKPVR